VQTPNNTHMFRSNIQLVTWNRFLRLLAVGRHLFFAAALGLVLCYWILVFDVFEWQKGSGVFSSAIYGLPLCWSVGLVVLALLDTRSRFQDYKRVKDLFFENGFKSRIAKIYICSRCQRDAVRVAAKDLGLLEQLDHFYQTQGYHWYHIFPDFVFKKPWLIFSQRYWRKTLFEPQYTSIYFLW
jgi:hypothetical protein